MRRPLLLLIISGVMFGVILAASLLTDRQATVTVPTPAAPLIDSTAPDFTVTTLDGKPLQLADLRGQPVFLNFWATWCIPCREEIPAFAAFTEAYGDQAIILAVNADRESPEAIRAFLTELDAENVPVALDPSGTVADLYAAPALPATYFIDPAGNIRTVRFGEVTYDDLTQFLAFLERTES
jgi:cytochrome c biogenesis protein CcmG, thiol:disulfide interchange protein DsbE